MVKYVKWYSKLEKRILNALKSDYKRYFFDRLQEQHTLTTTKRGDFIVNGKVTFEIGGEGKGFKQVKDVKNAFVVQDTDSTENLHKIPLWLFGFLY